MHWFSIVNSVLIVLFLAFMVAMILVRTLHKDISKYNRVRNKIFYLLLLFLFSSIITTVTILMLLTITMTMSITITTTTITITITISDNDR